MNRDSLAGPAPDDPPDHIELHTAGWAAVQQHAPHPSVEVRRGLCRHPVAREAIPGMDRLDIAVEGLLEARRLDRLYPTLLENSARLQLRDQAVWLIVSIGGVAFDERLHLVKPRRADGGDAFDN